MLEGISSWSEVYDKLKLVSTPVTDFKDLFLFSEKTKSSDKESQSLPSDLFLRTVKEHFPDYLSRRRFSLSEVEGFDLRFTVGGVYRNSIVFPYYDFEGRYITFCSRITKSKLSPYESRYRFPKGSPASQVLYGIHLFDSQSYVKRLFVVEGCFDTIRLWSFGEKAVGLSGSKSSSGQLLDLKRLSELTSAEVVVFLDEDAKEHSYSIHYELSSLGVKSSVLVPPKDRDPDSLTHEEFKAIAN